MKTITSCGQCPFYGYQDIFGSGYCMKHDMRVKGYHQPCPYYIETMKSETKSKKTMSKKTKKIIIEIVKAIIYALLGGSASAMI